ncbi:hypothetical protein E4U19_002952 [Claviceps sp. Clav32 group G5]|nr:hypothetical protein E4U19_002952 [Claviceps sp. Clav32 group G5]KAG6028542.1 hypothetical protein E4U40_000943 [Claviceps sp. LM458 group G5]KAG6047127.1 hypothetical protein E4U39_000716 [Claviceps sp. Clav50 group G5]
MAHVVTQHSVVNFGHIWGIFYGPLAASNRRSNVMDAAHTTRCLGPVGPHYAGLNQGLTTGADRRGQCWPVATRGCSEVPYQVPIKCNQTPPNAQ